jgi:lipoprotein signal peptidase
MKPGSRPSYVSTLWGLALAGVVLDQATKYGVFGWLYDERSYQGTYELVPGVFKFLAQFTDQREASLGLLSRLKTLSGNPLPRVNHGTLWSLGGEHANGVFAAVSVLAAMAIVYWSRRRSTSSDPALCAALGPILAGTLGNLYDRLVFGGVRDFLYFYWIEWPVFNAADCFLVCGATLLLAHAIWSRPSADVRQTSAAA